MRPLVSESSKTSETPVSPIFQISKKQSQICQRLKTLSPNIEGKVTKESAKSHHLYWSFHCVQIEATARKGEILPFFTTAIKCKGVTSIPSFTTYTLILACCERRTKNTRVTRLPAVEAIELVQVLPAVSRVSLHIHKQLWWLSRCCFSYYNGSARKKAGDGVTLRHVQAVWWYFCWWKKVRNKE